MQMRTGEIMKIMKPRKETVEAWEIAIIQLLRKLVAGGTCF